MSLSLRFARFLLGLFLFHLSLVLAQGDVQNSNCYEFSIGEKATLKFLFNLQELYSSKNKYLKMLVNGDRARLERKDNGKVKSYRFYEGNLLTSNCGVKYIDFHVSNAASEEGRCELHMNIYNNAVDFVSLQFDSPCSNHEFEAIRMLAPTLSSNQSIAITHLHDPRKILFKAQKDIEAFKRAHPDFNPSADISKGTRTLSEIEHEYLKLEEKRKTQQRTYDMWQHLKEDMRTQMPEFQSFVKEVKLAPRVHYIALTYQVQHWTETPSLSWRLPKMRDALHWRLNEYFATHQVFPGIQLRFELRKSNELRNLRHAARKNDRLNAVALHQAVYNRLIQKHKRRRAFPVHLHVLVTPEPFEGHSPNTIAITRLGSQSSHLFEKRAVLVLSTSFFENEKNDDWYLRGITHTLAHEILHTLGALHVNHPDDLMFSSPCCAQHQAEQRAISDFTKLIVLAVYKEKRDKCKRNDPSKLCKRPYIYAWLRPKRELKIKLLVPAVGMIEEYMAVCAMSSKT